MRCAIAILSLRGAFFLVSLQAGSVEGAGMELTVPGDPQRIRCVDEAG